MTIFPVGLFDKTVVSFSGLNATRVEPLHPGVQGQKN
jgi:hypothetical protein